MPKVLHDPIGEAMEKKFPLKLRCAKCKRTLEFSVGELEIKAPKHPGTDMTEREWQNMRKQKLATCKCVCGHELSTADRDVIFVVENYVKIDISEKPLEPKDLIEILREMGVTLDELEIMWADAKEIKEAI